MKRISAIMVIIIMLVAFVQCACADGSTVNVEALKDIEASDDFGLIITKKEIHPDDHFSLFNHDTLVITFKNRTKDTISGFIMNVIAYDKDRHQVKVQSSLDLSFRTSLNPEVFSASGVSIKPGEEVSLGLECDATEFEGVRIIVSSYSIAGHNATIDNPNAEKWVENAYSDRKLVTTILNNDADYSGVKQIPGETVDVETIRKIEKQDDFSVQCTAKTVKFGYGPNNFFGGPDYLVFDLYNDNEYEVQNISLYVLAFNNSLKPVTSFGTDIIQVVDRTSNAPKTLKAVNLFTTKKEGQDPIVLQPKATESFSIACTAENIVGIQVIVVSYETSGGREYHNHYADDWIDSIIASADTTYTLD